MNLHRLGNVVVDHRWGSNMAKIHGIVERYVECAKRIDQPVQEADQRSLVRSFFSMLGYDLTNPAEGLVSPAVNASTSGSCHAAAGGGDLVGAEGENIDERLARFCFTSPGVALAVETRDGVVWHFFTDTLTLHSLDQQPFSHWDALGRETPPYDLLALLQKSTFNPEGVRAYAHGLLLAAELTQRMNLPSEPPRLVASEPEMPAYARDIIQASQSMVAEVLTIFARSQGQRDQKTHRQAVLNGGALSHIPPHKAREAFALVRSLLGEDKAIGFQESVADVKVHLGGKANWVFLRLRLEQQPPEVWVPLPVEQATQLSVGLPVSSGAAKGWTAVGVDSAGQMSQLGDLFRAAYHAVNHVGML